MAGMPPNQVVPGKNPGALAGANPQNDGTPPNGQDLNGTKPKGQGAENAGGVQGAGNLNKDQQAA